ncbi:hypothetical protein Dform_01695 [Dehalogenimonas formicexedens]|uniref:Uncharacterized protein n=1 Tax=Dehalogenimonas formicexedens TaxID=1839801 RepID=A0A1P8F999_9CHLR|nr:hypothetical protein [Dehalogenimonas formicexedens]APV45015.1 hypothetical protein Dform_01695 [Dehalogenimonas formicexedens]
MAGAIDYQKQMSEIVYINLPGPAEPEAGMSGGELLHGFLAGLHDAPDQKVRDFVNYLSLRWNVVYRFKGADASRRMPIG